MKKTVTLLALASLAAASGAAYAQNRSPSGNPLSSIFNCQQANNKQGTGAVLGGVIGGVVGNKLSDDKKNNQTRNTIIGAAIGAAAGSYIGCKMGGDDGQRAQTATQTALQQGKSQSWQNSKTGATGRVDIVDTYNYGSNDYNQSADLKSIRWAQGVERPREYQPDNASYRATNNTPVRGGPSARSQQVGGLRNGDQVDGLARVDGTDWLLVGQGGVAIGYVLGSTLQEARGGQRNKQRYDPRNGPMCRTFDQTYQARGAAPETQRYTACQTVAGDWVMQNS